jgi:hypothetical protein
MSTGWDIMLFAACYFRCDEIIFSKEDLQVWAER